MLDFGSRAKYLESHYDVISSGPAERLVAKHKMKKTFCVMIYLLLISFYGGREGSPATASQIFTAARGIHNTASGTPRIPPAVPARGIPRIPPGPAPVVGSGMHDRSGDPLPSTTCRARSIAIA